MNRPRVLMVTTGVHLATSSIADVADRRCLPLDLAASARLPAWRRAEFNAVRILLRMLLADVADPAAAAAPLAEGVNGKPYLAGRPDVAVSLSHTDGWVAAAVALEVTTGTGGAAAKGAAGVAVGVDIEMPTRITDRLVRRCCSPHAYRRLTRVGTAARDLELAWIWTVQEACVKTTGEGLAGCPWTIPVEPGQRAGRWGRVRWHALRGGSIVPVSCAYLRDC